MTELNSDKTVLITGSSSGFGFFTSLHLAARGFKVYASMRNLSKQSALVNESRKQDLKINILQLDVNDTNSISMAIEEIAKKEGHIDVLINNAGYGLGGFFEDLDETEIRNIMETNFFGLQNVTRAVIPLMRNRQRGKIINISSISGFSASPAFGAYAASKWAVEGFSESLHYELKPFGIDVLLVEPGSYPTKIFEENAQYAKRFNDTDSPYFKRSQHLKHKVNTFVASLKNDPNEVSRLIERLINIKKPSFRTIPDTGSQIKYILKKILPFKAYSWMNEKILYHDFKN